MVDKDSSERCVILAGHGASGGRDLNINRIADHLQSCIPEITVKIGRLSDGDSLLADMNSKTDVLILPMLFSDGYFYSRKLLPLKQQYDGTAINLTISEPLGLWPSFANMLSDLATANDIRIVAHGSARTSESRRCAQGLASHISESKGINVHCVFLEEEPFAQKEAADFPEESQIMGLFLERGMHGGADFEEVVSRAPESNTSMLIGDVRQLDDIVVDQVNRWLGP